MLQGWTNYFIMTGSSAATLVGLLFVVITLCASLAVTPAARAVRAFLTPVLVHFGAVLTLSLILLVPWSSRVPLAIAIALHGIAGLVYAAIVTRLFGRLDFNPLTLRARLVYSGGPALANLALIAGAAGLYADRPFAGDAIAGAAALLLLLALVESWDVTLWIIANREQPGLSRIEPSAKTSDPGGGAITPPPSSRT
jgi:hypothetical protein